VKALDKIFGRCLEIWAMLRKDFGRGLKTLGDAQIIRLLGET